jgi:hypothetical protein
LNCESNTLNWHRKSLLHACWTLLFVLDPTSTRSRTLQGGRVRPMVHYTALAASHLSASSADVRADAQSPHSCQIHASRRVVAGKSRGSKGRPATNTLVAVPPGQRIIAALNFQAGHAACSRSWVTNWVTTGPYGAAFALARTLTTFARNEQVVHGRGAYVTHKRPAARTGTE